MRTSLWFFAIGAALLCSPSASADSTNRYWLMYEQGNTAASQKEYGTALQLYKDAIEGLGIFPEAEAAVGDVYLAEGELVLAQKQYEKAYDLRKSFYIFEDQYTIKYKLANLFEIQQRYKQMEDALLAITNDDTRFQETPNLRLRSQVEKLYLEKGLDRALVLYNFEDSFAAAAHSKLGWFYYRTGRFTQAISQLLYSVIYRVSQIVRSRVERDVDFQFSTLAELLAATDRAPDLKEYANSTGLCKDLYYLACCTFASGYPRHSSTIWKLLAGTLSAGQYRELSTRQLKKPFTEPLLTVAR